MKKRLSILLLLSAMLVASCQDEIQENEAPAKSPIQQLSYSTNYTIFFERISDGILFKIHMDGFNASGLPYEKITYGGTDHEIVSAYYEIPIYWKKDFEQQMKDLDKLKISYTYKRSKAWYNYIYLDEALYDWVSL